jgi:hypothetical protein
MVTMLRPLSLLAALGLVAGCATGMGGAETAPGPEMGEQIRDAVPITEVIAAAKDHVDGRVWAAVFYPQPNRYVVRLADEKDQCWRMDFAADSGDLIKAAPAAQAKQYSDPCAPFGQRNPEGFPAW